MPEQSELHRIVVVGGGAGGLELVTHLGDKLGKRKRAPITLIDANPTHLWKPLLHEVAAGILDSNDNELDYLAHARNHHYQFRLGRMEGLDRRQRQVILAPVVNEEAMEIIPRCRFTYDTLIIAIGSITNDFGTPGADQYCTYLDSQAQADRFRRRLLENYLRTQVCREAGQHSQLSIAIIGAGATGVELAAELRNTSRQMSAYGLDRIDPPCDVKLTLIEAMGRILPPLPERVAETTLEDLRQLDVAVYTGEKVTQVTEHGVHTASGRFIPAQLIVWSAGVKAPEFLRDLDGLEVNNKNQLVVLPTLQTSRDANIFAFGDCAACESKGKPVPPRAQAAHQQASLLVKSMSRRLKGRPLPEYIYKDFGSLISLSRYSAVGTLMGNLVGRVILEGKLARLVYLSLYKQHQLALHGFLQVTLVTLVNLVRSPTKPRLKLH
jgi:NADH dehydrogenase